MKKVLGLFVLVGAFAGASASAQEMHAGLHVGAIGSTAQSAIGYGVNFGVNPDGIAAFQLDATFANFDNGLYFSSSPAIVVYPVYHEEFLLGIMGGAGFYKFPDVNVRFGVNFGVTGDFTLTPQMSVGMEGRFHPIFGTPDDVWSVFLTLKYKFEGDSGW